MMKLCLLHLTCANNNEADKIVQTLLQKHLIACAKKIPVASQSWWQEKIENTDEVLLIMESCEEKFEEVEKEVVRLHSYDTPVLISVSIDQISKKAKIWLKKIVG